MTHYYSDESIERSKKLCEPHELWQLVYWWAVYEKEMRDLLQEIEKLKYGSQEYLIAYNKIQPLGDHIDYVVKFGVLVRLGIYKSDKYKQKEAQ